MKIVFATGNSGKLHEASEILGEGFELVTPAAMGITEDIPENGKTLRANSFEKAKHIWDKTECSCFADDTGLEVEILGGAPGVYTARYAGEDKNPQANMDKLLREMDRRICEASIMRELGIPTPHANRRARFRTSVALILDGVSHFFDGVMEGNIALSKSGAGGFGYDPVFIPDGTGGLTAAEIGDTMKNAISHRGKAMRALADYLRHQ
ncbi:MAG: RdgB/HAM1 family non-canonical purine NTP pyrophosphatase [Bacteroidales bacterium]|nr:RdgB/HAM1 family non-canonical purine NTP pyrophosphatase [Bacteroidales bacterium]